MTAVINRILVWIAVHLQMVIVADWTPQPHVHLFNSYKDACNYAWHPERPGTEIIDTRLFPEWIEPLKTEARAMNGNQRKAVDDQIRKGCGKCHEKATVVIIWSFEDTTKPNVTEHPILAFVCCDAHVDGVRAERPQALPHIFVRVTEESLKPLIFQ